MWYIEAKYELAFPTVGSYIWSRFAMVLEHILLAIPLILLIVKVMEWSGNYVSLVFLLVTFYVYKAVPDLYNLHGKIVISNVVSIFLVTLYLIIVFNIIPSNSLFCVVLGYLVITSCLFCFFTI